MAGDWYCLIGDREYGPLDGHKLRQLAHSGQLSEESLVRKGADGHWVTANHVAGLFAATNGDGAHSVPIPPAPAPESPQAGKRLTPNLRAALIGFAAACAVFAVAGLAYYFGRHSAAPSAADRAPTNSAPESHAPAQLTPVENQTASIAEANLKPGNMTDAEQAASKSDAIAVTPNFAKKDSSITKESARPADGGTTATKENANVVALNSSDEKTSLKPLPPPAKFQPAETARVQPASAVETVPTAPKDQLVSISPTMAKDEERPLATPSHVSTPTRDPRDVKQLLAGARQSVAAIQVRRGKKEAENIGLGFVVAPRVVATNYHIIEGARGVKITFPGRDMVFGKGFYKIDPERDLALIECDTGDLKPVALATSRPNVNDSVHALSSNGAISSGAISGLGNSPNAFMMQSTATISPESSGGPLLNDNAEAIGITTRAFVGGKRVDVAISTEHVAELLASAGKKSQLWTKLPPPRPPQQPPSNANANASPQQPNTESPPSNSPPQQFGDSQATSTAESLIAAIKESQEKSDQNAAIQGELNRIQQQASSITNAITTLQSEFNNLTAQRGQAANRRAAMYDRARQAHINRDQLQQSLQNAQIQLNSAKKTNLTQVGPLNQKIAGLQSSYNYAAQQYASLLSSWTSLNNEVEGYDRRISDTSLQGNNAVQALNNLRREYDQVRAQATR
jgi:S1-C subfamily serine protease